MMDTTNRTHPSISPEDDTPDAGLPSGLLGFGALADIADETWPEAAAEEALA